MKDIFTELYNKVISFFQSEKGENTKEMASNRLKLVLMHDRTKLDPLTIEKMRGELIDVISKYVVIDKELLELNLAGEGNSIALMLNIPVVRAKTEEELAELKAQDEQSEQEKNEEDEENEETVSSDDDDEEDETHNEEEIPTDNQDSLNEALDSEDSAINDDEAEQHVAELSEENSEELDKAVESKPSKNKQKKEEN